MLYCRGMKLARLLPLCLLGLSVFTGATIYNAQAQTVTNLTGCQNITSNGNYRLANNVSSSGTCFSIRGNVSSLTFDGNGKTITSSSGDALEVADFGSGTPHHVTISNIISSSGVRTYGNLVHHITFEDLQVDGITIYGSDDVTIQNNTLGSGGISVGNADQNWPPYRPIITNNEITGQVGHTNKILLEVAGGPSHPCPRIDAVVTNNTVLNYRNDPPPEATADIRIRCATHSVVTGNYFRSFGTTIGLYIRDESDDARYENNTFWVNSQEAIRIASGNNDKTFPARNVFSNNLFRSDAGKATYFQGVGSDNLFEYNVFMSATRNDFINGAHNNTFNHNTFYLSGSDNLALWDYDVDPADTFTNNIFSYSGTNIWAYDTFLASRYIGNYNLFHNRSGSLSFGSFGSSLSAWRTATGDDAQSISGNPLFADTTGTFALSGGSPALNAASDGTNIGAWQNSSCTESWTCGSWSACSNNTQTRSCTDANACGTTVTRPATSQSCDSTAPTVSITSPAASATVSGTISVTATASDTVGVAGVQFKLDGVNLGSEDTASPFSYSWNTTSASNGSHTLTAVARDAAGNSTTSASITFTVNNSAGCTESWTCGSWSACNAGSQSRTCTDANNCGTTTTRPVLTQSCSDPDGGHADSTPPAAISNLSAQ